MPFLKLQGSLELPLHEAGHSGRGHRCPLWCQQERPDGPRHSGSSGSDGVGGDSCDSCNQEGAGECRGACRPPGGSGGFEVRGLSGPVRHLPAGEEPSILCDKRRTAGLVLPEAPLPFFQAPPANSLLHIRLEPKSHVTDADTNVHCRPCLNRWAHWQEWCSQRPARSRLWITLSRR